MVERRRPCRGPCGRNRAERFFTSPRGHICDTCRKRRRGASGKNLRLQETYDITLEEWLAILAFQGDCCAICHGKRATYDTDHDHKRERTHGVRASIRGLLCKRCNRRLLPACLDNIDILLRAIAYLQRPPAQEVLT